MLADMATGAADEQGVLGYAWFYGGPAIVVTEERHAGSFSSNSREQYFNSVAHELGHSLLDLCHTHETSARTDEYGGECDIQEEVHTKRYDPPAFQDYHDNYIFDEDDISVMSYQYAMSKDTKESYTLASDHISCRQLYTKELQIEDCRGFDVLDPDYDPDDEAHPPSEPEGSLPGLLTAVDAVGRDGEILVKWSPPFDDGGTPLTGYRIEYSDGERNRISRSDIQPFLSDWWPH